MDTANGNTFGGGGGGMPVISSGGSGAGAGSAMPISSGGAPVISAGGSPGISSGTGDVVLAPSAGGSRKRWPIVVGVLAVVAIVVVILVAVLVPRGSNNTASPLVSSFNQAANYMLFGTSSQENITESYNSNVYYELGNKLTANDVEIEGISDFLTASNSYWQTFYANYQSSGYNIPEYVVLAARIQNVNQALPFLINYYNIELPTENEIWEKYLADGEEATINLMSEKHALLVNSEAEYTKQFGDYLVAFINASLNEIKMIESAGCLVGGEVDGECVLTAGLSVPENESAAAAEDTMYSYAPGLIPTVEESLFIIAAELRNPTTSVEEAISE